MPWRCPDDAQVNNKHHNQEKRKVFNSRGGARRAKSSVKLAGEA
jgi:hypothetical protein